MPKDKTIKGKIKRAVKRAKKAKKKPKTRTITKKIGQQQTQRVVLNLADTGKRGGFGIGASAFPTIVQRDTSDIGAGLGNILTELREQKKAVLDLQRTQQPPMFYQARRPMMQQSPTQTSFMKYDDQQGTFPVSNFRPRIFLDETESEQEIEQLIEEEPITELKDPISMEKEGVIESQVETPEKSGEIKPTRKYRERITKDLASKMTTEQLEQENRTRSSEVIRAELRKRQQEEKEELVERAIEMGKQEGAMLQMKKARKKQPENPPTKGASGGSARPPSTF
jgi:hypothetical protein